MSAAGSLKTVVVDVRSFDETVSDLKQLTKTGTKDGAARISFPTWDELHRVLAPNRMAVVKAMTGAGPLSIREVARRVERDFKGVHSDVTTLVRNGLLDRLENGSVVFPFATLRVEFAHAGVAA